MGKTRFVTIDGPAGRIEGILQGEGSAARIGVVCHPHPLAGGTMHTKVVHRAARALEKAGHCVLRFNFRGVGASEGVHDRGGGEQEDVRAALAWMRASMPGRPATLAGFSFGSWVGLRVGCADPGVDALIGIAAPANIFDFEFLRRCGKPKIFIHGTADRIAPLEDLEAIYGEAEGPKALVRLTGGTHLLVESLDPLEEAIVSFADRLPRPTS